MGVPTTMAAGPLSEMEICQSFAAMTWILWQTKKPARKPSCDQAGVGGKTAPKKKKTTKKTANENERIDVAADKVACGQPQSKCSLPIGVNH